MRPIRDTAKPGRQEARWSAPDPRGIDRRRHTLGERGRSVFSCPDANGVLHGTDRDAAARPVVGTCQIDDGQRDRHRVLVGNDDLELESRVQFGVVGGAAVLTAPDRRFAAHADLGHREPLHPTGKETVTHQISMCGTMISFDLLHRLALSLRCEPARRVTAPTRSHEACQRASHGPA